MRVTKNCMQVAVDGGLVLQQPQQQQQQQRRRRRGGGRAAVHVHDVGAVRAHQAQRHRQQRQTQG